MGASFVDDTSLRVTSTYAQDPAKTALENQASEVTHVISHLKALAQHWERLKFSTGGAINMQKSHWYLMSWVYKQGILRLATICQTPSGLALATGTTETEEVVPRIEPTQAFWTLGVYISGSGSQAKQMSVLRNHSEQYKEH